ncbi:gliding motility lipoprotein GldH [Brumimicrobium salinarum]|nr:gliding motility lipoprotein GldH [Brumimicrobium salinarum]
MRNKSLVFLVFAIVVIQSMLTTSCTSPAMYDQTYDFENQSWSKSDTAIFEVEVGDTVLNRDFILSLRTTKSYLYSNLWIYIMITAPDGSTSKVAQKIPLANPDGSWIGRVSGSLVESRLRFDSKPFPIKGTYVFKMVNATQEEVIGEVLDIGLRIE